MIDLGIVRPGSTIRIPFSSFDKDDGSSITMTNYAAADILVYKDGSTTERASTAGFTATTDFDTKTGKHLAIIDLADNTTADFYKAGSEYHVAIDAVTVDAVTTGGWIARFRIGQPGAWFDTGIATLASQTSFTLTAGPAEDDALNDHWAIIHDAASAVQCARVQISDYTGSTKTVTLAAGATFTAAAGDNISIMGPMPMQPATTGRKPVVDTAGLVDANTVKVGPRGSGTAQTARDVGASVLLSSGTGTGQLDFTAGVVKANLAQILGTALTETAGLIAAGFKQFFNIASPTSTMNTITTVTTATNLTNAATAGDLTATMKTSVTTAATAATPIAASVTGNVGGSVGSIATGGITAASFAAGAIDAAAIAADAIGASELAASAVTEIRSLASGTSDSGTTTTMVDAARTEADADYWDENHIIVFTSGTISGQARVITGFDATTDTITFSPATTQAVGTQTYEIWPIGAALRPTVHGRTLDVSAGGEGGVDWSNVGSPTTVVGLSGTTVKTATDVEADTQDLQTRTPAALTAGGNMKSDALAISGDAVAADNAEAFFDGTGYAGTNNVIPTVTNLTGHTPQTGDSFARIGAAGVGLTSVRLSTTGIADVWAYVIEGSWTAVMYMRLMASALVAKLSGAATATVTIRDVDDTKNRLVVTVDADGNRSAFGTRDGT